MGLIALAIYLGLKSISYSIACITEAKGYKFELTPGAIFSAIIDLCIVIWFLSKIYNSVV